MSSSSRRSSVREEREAGAELVVQHFERRALDARAELGPRAATAGIASPWTPASGAARTRARSPRAPVARSRRGSARSARARARRRSARTRRPAQPPSRARRGRGSAGPRTASRCRRSRTALPVGQARAPVARGRAEALAERSSRESGPSWRRVALSGNARVFQSHAAYGLAGKAFSRPSFASSGSVAPPRRRQMLQRAEIMHARGRVIS